MRQMRNARTGRVAVYDADLVESGKWEEVKTASKPKSDEPPAAQAVAVEQAVVVEQVQEPAPKAKHEGKQLKA